MRKYTDSRRGNVLFVTVILLPAMFAVISLAVDFGKVQLAKSQLQDACDASTRAAAMKLGTSYNELVVAAKSAAADNFVDGKSLALADTDIEIGRYDVTQNEDDEDNEDGEDTDSVFSVLPSSDFAEANAVRITARRIGDDAIPLTFAPIIGVPAVQLATHCTSVRRTSGSLTYGIAGISGISVGDKGKIDSYDSSLGKPNKKKNPGGAATVASNGAITVGNKASIKGDAYYTTTIPTGSITGDRIPMGGSLNLPTPVLPTFYTNLGSISLNNSTQTLSTGAYLVNSLTLRNKAKLKISAAGGPVKLFVNGPISIEDKAKIKASSPANVEIYVLKDAAVTIEDKSKVTAQIYAPLSTVRLNRKCRVYGSVVGKSVSVDDKSTLYIDKSLNILGSNAYGIAGSVTVVMVE
jgi:Flp pilus assembly protein TadG/cytoskeletal protein CcmA (bactofilin family)